MAEKIEKRFICLGQNTEKYISFSVPVEKEVTRTHKNHITKVAKIISHRLQFIYSARFMGN